MYTRLLFPLIAVIASAQVPSIATSNGSAAVTNAASFQPGLTPGGIVTIFGTNLGAAPGQTLIAPGSPWPQQLGSTVVTINGVPAPIYYVLNQNGSEQLSVQAPWSLAGTTAATVTVTTSAGISSPVTVPVVASQPGIFLLDASSSGAVHASTGAIVTASNPAAPEEYVVLYLTGMGAVQHEPATGAAGLSTASNTLAAPQVLIGSTTITPSYSGLAPGFVGLYQINVLIPATIGLQDVTVEVYPGVTSNIAKIAVQGTCSYVNCGTPGPQFRP
jgi:uncharacterized protein (TIGR03437 family)